MSRLSFRFQRPLHGVGVDFGSSSVKAVGLAWDQKGLSLLGAGQEPLAPGVVREGAVRDPAAAGAALSALLRRLRIRCRLAAFSLGGSSVFVKRLPAPAAAASEAAFREAVGREAARHIPFHLEALEFDYRRIPASLDGLPTSEPGAPEGRGTLVFGAAPRETVRAHCDAANRGGLEVARIELEPYALFAAARLAMTSAAPAPPAGPIAFVEIGASRAAAHVFGLPPTPSFPADDPQSGRPGDPAADGGAGSPGDLLASVRTPGGGPAAAAPDESEDAAAVFARRVAASLREVIRDAGLAPPLPTHLAGGAAGLPEIPAALAGVAAGDPAPLDPLGRFGAESAGPALAVAAGLAAQELLTLAGSRPRRAR